MHSKGIIYDIYVMCRVRFNSVKEHLVSGKHRYWKVKNKDSFLSFRKYPQSPLKYAHTKNIIPYWIKNTYRVHTYILANHISFTASVQLVSGGSAFVLGEYRKHKELNKLLWILWSFSFNSRKCCWF